MKKNKKGFTLIELLVVVLIIGVLAGIALPKYRTITAKSKLMQAFVLAKAVKDAEETYYTAHRQYTTDFDALLVDVGEYKVITDMTNILRIRLKSNNYTIEIALNGTGGANNRVEVYLPNTFYHGITYYFNHEAAGYYGQRKGRHCFAEENAFKKACISMGGVDIGQSGRPTCRAYQLP